MNKFFTICLLFVALSWAVDPYVIKNFRLDHKMPAYEDSILSPVGDTVFISVEPDFFRKGVVYLRIKRGIINILYYNINILTI